MKTNDEYTGGSTTYYQVDITHPINEQLQRKADGVEQGELLPKAVVARESLAAENQRTVPVPRERCCEHYPECVHNIGL